MSLNTISINDLLGDGGLQNVGILEKDSSGNVTGLVDPVSGATLPLLLGVVSFPMASSIITPSSSWQAVLLGDTVEFESITGVFHYDGDLLESWLDLAPAIAIGATHFCINGSISVTTGSTTGTRGIRAVSYTDGQTMGSQKTPPLLATGIQGIPYNTRKIPMSFITDTDKRLRFEVLQDSAASLTFGGDVPLSRMSIEFWSIPQR